jgi:hypothetical protein
MGVKYMQRLLILLFLSCVFTGFSFPQSTEFPKRTFVTSREGLRVRSRPSLNSEIRDIYFYAQMVLVYAKSERMNTIDGITDFWYRVSAGLEPEKWVFGGYLSEIFPEGAHIIYGQWLNKGNNDNLIYWYLHIFYLIILIKKVHHHMAGQVVAHGM